MEKIPMTAQGYAALEAEIKHLKTVERPAIIKAISEARAHGDLSENAEYHSAKERQSFIEGRVMELEDKVSRAQVIDVSKLSGKTVKFGATVSVVDEDTEQKSKFQIVGDMEADFAKGRISLSSPLARALIGKSVGDTVEVNTPFSKQCRYAPEMVPPEHPLLPSVFCVAMRSLHLSPAAESSSIPYSVTTKAPFSTTITA
jgi:transcription elongation factor GreA